jgi:4-amino-4-deoxy-L-arabinose transferase-like glycosyltransferase
VRRDRFLWIVFALGALLRFWRIAGDLPYVFHYDEPTLIDNAVWLIQHGSPNPHFFNYPTGLIYLLAILFGIVAIVRTAFGRFDGMHGAIAWLASHTYPQPPEGGVLYFYPTIGVPALYLIGRCVSAVAGLAVIALVYAIARRIAEGRAVARIAALAVAISPLTVEHSRLITTDMTATALATGCILAILAARGGGARRWIVAGALGGFAAGFKYNSGLVVLILPLLSLWLWRTPHTGLRGRTGSGGRPPLGPISLLGCAAAAAVVAFLVTTPFALLDSSRFARDLGYELHRVASITASFQGAEAIEATPAEKVAWVFLSNFGILGLIAAAWGAIVALRSRRFEPIAVFAWVVLLLIPLLRWKSLYARYLLPVWPGVLLLSSLGIADGAMRITRRIRSAPAIVVTSLICAAVLGQGAVRLCQLEAKWTGHDPRVAMTEWIEKNVPAGEKIVSETGGPFPDPERYAIDRIDFLGRSTPEAYRADGIRYLAGSGRERLIAGKEPFRDVMANLGAIRAGSDLAWSQGRYAIYRMRGEAAWEDTVREAIAAGDSRKAREILERRVRTPDGAIPFAWRRLADVRGQAGDTSGACEAWKQVARLDTTDVEALLALGSLSTSMKKWDAAKGYLERALRISPRDPLTNHNIAVVLLYRAQEKIRGGRDRDGARADWEGARARAELAAKVSPGDPNMTRVLDQVIRMGQRWGFIAR